MTVTIDIKVIRDKALLLIPPDQEALFASLFDEEMYADLIENVDDYIAEGVAAHFLDM